jgi:hypothetical protein
VLPGRLGSNRVVSHSPRDSSVSSRASRLDQSGNLKDSCRADFLEVVLIVVLEDVLNRLGGAHEVRDEDARLIPCDSTEFGPRR